MNRTVVYATLFAAMAAAGTALADSHLVKGTVTKVDAAAQKMTIRHGPMKKFDMHDGMTMVFRVKDPAMLKQVKPGDDIRFDADRIEGAFTVIELEKHKYGGESEGRGPGPRPSCTCGLCVKHDQSECVDVRAAIQIENRQRRAYDIYAQKRPMAACQFRMQTQRVVSDDGGCHANAKCAPSHLCRGGGHVCHRGRSGDRRRFARGNPNGRLRQDMLRRRHTDLRGKCARQHRNV
jgi:Cu(I)/Ag(I) efflux system periplasmic protein CusF